MDTDTPWTLYLAPGTCAQAVHIALCEAAVPLRLIKLNLAGGQQHTPEYLALNPLGRVPALVTSQGTLVETPALLAFVAQSCPAARLGPVDDAFAWARVQAFNSYLASTVHVAHAHKHRGVRWSDDPASWEAMKAKVGANMREAFALIGRDWWQGPWVFGEQYTVADPYLYTIGEWLEGDGVDTAAFPWLLEHRERMRARPAVQQARATLEALA
ncbi:glutathione S-transferase [Ideonella sp. B7]|uniref:glutathione S-transferase family protein n=1 Tax=Ideonella benzenivorans TaxID=2831643 RepID=UPI001CED9254|nr:glutathione S-transferase [Ideonella benzenivorans]MCA6215126.1 glutathione S-transferase [Ideonella benzenivorans]